MNSLSGVRKLQMRIEQELKLDFDDVLIKPKRSTMKSRSDVELIRKFKLPISKVELNTVGIIASNMDTVGTFAMCEALAKHNAMTCLHKFYNENQLVDFFTSNKASECAFYTLGITDEDIAKLKSVSSRCNINKICIDVANGYSVFFQKQVVKIREMFPEAVIMAGNVATPEMVQELLITGRADIVKIGIGPGSACTTRLITGVGYPQLSAIIECADAAHGLGGLICGDGGCRYPADVAKGFGAGADFMMLGGMLAGCDECEGEWIHGFEQTNDPDVVNTVKTKLKFYGMSSKEAQEKYYNGMSKYKASEGRAMFVDYKGPVDETIQTILGGLRSACSYVGAMKLKDLSKCTTFVQVPRDRKSVV